ncbi:MAG: hypothetical protein PHP92_03210 [Candidatus Nanoarchaeia archaeon]|nr:hypothetical protein [Candidatus Nanoarchaeia archaeon]
MKYLNFDNQEKGYREFSITKDNVIKNKGKNIVYLRGSDVDKYRGYVFPQYGILYDMRYSILFLNDGNTEVDVRDIIECGIKD